MRRTRLALVFLAVLSFAAFASSAALATPSIPIPPPAQAQAKAGLTQAPLPSGAEAARLRKQDQLLPEAHALADQARNAASDIAGVSLDVDAGVVNVYRKNTHAPLNLDGAPVDVVVHQAKFSHGELVAAQQRLLGDAKSLGNQHVAVEAVGPA